MSVKVVLLVALVILLIARLIDPWRCPFCKKSMLGSHDWAGTWCNNPDCETNRGGGYQP